jgi:hypothetical protein
MKLTRKQELALIQIGLKVHLDSTLHLEGTGRDYKAERERQKRKKSSNAGTSWSPERRKKFLRTIKAKWVAKRAEKNKAA